MLKLKLHSIVMYMYPSSRLIKHQDHWISYIELNFIGFFSSSRKLVPFIKEGKSSRFFFYSLLKQNCILFMYLYLYIKLTGKINILQKELCDNWTMLVHHYECCFCYCSGVHTRLHHGQHVPTTAVRGRKYFRWSRKGKLCPNNRRWLDQIPGRFNQGILLLLYFFNFCIFLFKRVELISALNTIEATFADIKSRH